MQRFPLYGEPSTIGKFYTPVSIVLGAGGTVYVADDGAGLNGVFRVNPGSAEKRIGTGLDHPRGLALNAHGDLLIADSSHDRLVKLSAAGAQSTLISGLSDPRGLALDASRALDIADFGNDRVLRVTNGGQISVISRNVLGPVAVAVSLFPDDLTCSELGRYRIVTIGRAGRLTRVPVSVTACMGLAVDVQGNLYLADTGNSRIVEYRTGN